MALGDESFRLNYAMSMNSCRCTNVGYEQLSIASALVWACSSFKQKRVLMV